MIKAIEQHWHDFIQWLPANYAYISLWLTGILGIFNFLTVLWKMSSTWKWILSFTMIFLIVASAWATYSKDQADNLKRDQKESQKESEWKSRNDDLTKQLQEIEKEQGKQGERGEKQELNDKNVNDNLSNIQNYGNLFNHQVDSFLFSINYANAGESHSLDRRLFGDFFSHYPNAGIVFIFKPLYGHVEFRYHHARNLENCFTQDKGYMEYPSIGYTDIFSTDIFKTSNNSISFNYQLLKNDDFSKMVAPDASYVYHYLEQQGCPLVIKIENVDRNANADSAAHCLLSTIDNFLFAVCLDKKLNSYFEIEYRFEGTVQKADSIWVDLAMVGSPQFPPFYNHFLYTDSYAK